MFLCDLPAFAPVEEGHTVAEGLKTWPGQQGNLVLPQYHGQGHSHMGCTELQAARVGETLGDSPWFSFLSWMPAVCLFLRLS